MANLTYKEAGVDIDAGEELVERIKAPVKRTNRPEVIGGLGGFGALTRIPQGYKKPSFHRRSGSRCHVRKRSDRTGSRASAFP